MRKAAFGATVWALLSAAGLFSDHTAKIPQVIGFDPDNGIVVIRDTETSRTMQFKADAKVIKTLKVGDWVEAEMATGRVTAVKGVAVAYRLVEPDQIGPCCAIAKLGTGSPSPAVLVTARNNATGRTFQFQVEEPTLAKSLVAGQTVSMVGGTTAWALVRIGAATYSFSVR